ncbi:MAG: hypothetical protein ACRCTD_08240 [Beijerinckiaceae bacterium]
MTPAPEAQDTGPSAAPRAERHDYEAILAAVSETPRGRWFLAEYARRNRAADTTQVLDQIARLETLLALQNPAIAAAHRLSALDDLATVLALKPDGSGDMPADGLTPDVVTALAAMIGHSGDVMRDASLTARGALLSARENAEDKNRTARFFDALDRQLKTVDAHAGAILDSAARVEALAQVIAQLRARMRIVLQYGAAAGQETPAPQPHVIPVADMPVPDDVRAVTAPQTNGARPPSLTGSLAANTGKAAVPREELSRPVPVMDASVSDAQGMDEPAPAFEQVWQIPHAQPDARLRHVAALMQDGPEDDFLEDSPLTALAQSVQPSLTTQPTHAGRTLAELDRLGYTERAALFA